MTFRSNRFITYKASTRFEEKPLQLVKKSKSKPISTSYSDSLLYIIKIIIFPMFLTLCCLNLIFNELPMFYILNFGFIDHNYSFLKRSYRFIKNLCFDGGGSLKSIDSFGKDLINQLQDEINMGLLAFWRFYMNNFYIKEYISLRLKFIIKFYYDCWIQLDVVLDKIMNLPSTITKFVKDAIREDDYFSHEEVDAVDYSTIRANLSYHQEIIEDVPQLSFAQTRAERPLQSREELIDNYFCTFDAVMSE